MRYVVHVGIGMWYRLVEVCGGIWYRLVKVGGGFVVQGGEGDQIVHGIGHYTDLPHHT